MKPEWFVRKGILYWPVGWLGWIILLAAIALSVYQFIIIDSHSHSVSDTLINWFFSLLLTGLGYTLIGYFAERRSLER